MVMRIEHFLLAESGGVPNNPRLPVLFYRAAFEDAGDVAAAMERRFAGNGWSGLWRDGVFDYQHFHTEAHEVLGFARGHARLVIGGPHGRVIEVCAGDVVLLPAGTGHCRLSASADFLVIGGYPQGQRADMRRPVATDRDRLAIAAVPLPKGDPVAGAGGPLAEIWSSAA